MKVPEGKMIVKKVSCDICMKEIPPSEINCVEAEDYVMNFCGLDCYDKWRKQEEQKEQKKA